MSSSNVFGPFNSTMEAMAALNLLEQPIVSITICNPVQTEQKTKIDLFEERMKRMEADGRPARAAFERRKEQKRIEHRNENHKRGYHNHVRIERSFKCIPTAEEQVAIDAENKIIEEKKLQKEQEAIIQKQKARLEALKRAKERKIEEEARRRIDEMAEQLAFESAVQKKMTELLASTSTLDARMKLREAELKDLFM
jgi:hypothetical protein